MINIFKSMQPTLLIDGHNIQNQIEALNSFSENVNEECKKIVQNDIKLLQIGLSGENKILYELLNSNIPMYIFHDVRYGFDGLDAQIDFVIVTSYKIFIIECKNIIGNVIVNSDGNFIREFNNKREGMYSPLTQNKRHMDIVLNIMYSKKGLLGKLFFDKTIKQHIESLIVFVNPKTIIKKKYAPKSIRNKILRADEIGEYIRNTISSCEFKNLDIESFADFFKYNNIVKEINYTGKYERYIVRDNIFDRNNLINDLKKYRINKSKANNLKPYYIFTNEQLDNIIEILPKNKKELLNIKGFGEFKINEYGDDIVNIINKYLQ